MRVGLLTYGLERPLSGVGRVALELGRALAPRPECEITFLTPYRRGPFADGSARRVYLPGCRLLPGLMLLGPPLIALAARALELDVVHDPVGVSPFLLGRWAGPFRRVVTVHDAIAFQYPQGYSWLNNFLHRRYIPATLGHVDAVATVSRVSRDAIVRHLGVPAERVAVVPNGVSARFARVPAEQARATAARYGLDSYVLYVGAFQARKNVLRLVDAYARARRQIPGTDLALVGPPQWSYPELEARLKGAEGVRMVGYVADEDLPALYSHAAAFVLPSLHEGFGIPLLEAMACGAPTICADASSLPEVAGGASMQVDPMDVDRLAAAIARVVTDRDLAEDLRRRGLARSRAFTWDAAAEAYLALYRRLLGG
jgi:glycosyltransferase involved in cell wall biosynthesis